MSEELARTTAERKRAEGQVAELRASLRRSEQRAADAAVSRRDEVDRLRARCGREMAQVRAWGVV